MRIGAGTDKGKAREVNQDSFYISCFNDSDFNNSNLSYSICDNLGLSDEALNLNYFVVADGMGGHNAGEIASGFVVEFFKNHLRSRLKACKSENEIVDLLKESIKEANTELIKKSAQREEFAGMGTTVIVCVLDGRENKIYTAHVGDSRLYLIHNNGEDIRRITTDHSMVEELLNSGTITKQEAKKHPNKNMITRAVGGELTIRPDIFINTVTEGDIVLICTDGLTNMVKDKEILKVFKRNEDLQAAVDELISLSNLRGGLDNITIIAIGL